MNTRDLLDLPTYADVIAASKRLEGHAHKTPVLTSRTVDDELGATVFFKCENLQRMGHLNFVVLLMPYQNLMRSNAVLESSLSRQAIMRKQSHCPLGYWGFRQRS